MDQKIPEIFEKTGQDVAKLNITEKEQFLKYLENALTVHLKTCLETESIPIIMIGSCCCGCGNQIILMDENCMSIEKAIKTLEQHVIQLKEHIKKSN